MEDASIVAEDRNLREAHLLEHRGVRMLLDVERADFFEVDDVVAAVVGHLQGHLPLGVLESRYSPSSISRAVADLEKNGFFDQEEAVDASEEEGFPHNQVIENLVINVSNDCNLRCRYCFANTGPYQSTRALMDESTGRRTIEWFLAQASDKETLNLHFFGGEPFTNVELVGKLSDYVRCLEQEYAKRVLLNVCTNGTILDDGIIDMIRRHEMGMQISIDGPKALHDAFRPFANGRGSYDTTARNVEHLLEVVPADRIIARATIPHSSVSIADVVEHLLDMGFNKVFFVPAMGGGKWAVGEDDLAELRQQYEDLAETYMEKRRNGHDYHVFPFEAEVSNVGEGVRKLYGCGAGLGFASVSIDGTIYPCMRFTDNATYSLGSVRGGVNPARRTRLIERTVDQRPTCSSCWARYLCGGACIAVSAEKNLDIKEPDPIGCSVAKLVARLAMYVNAKLSAEGIEAADSSEGDFDFVRRNLR